MCVCPSSLLSRKTICAQFKWDHTERFVSYLPLSHIAGQVSCITIYNNRSSTCFTPKKCPRETSFKKRRSANIAPSENVCKRRVIQILLITYMRGLLAPNDLENKVRTTMCSMRKTFTVVQGT